MQSASDRFFEVVSFVRVRNGERVASSWFIALLIALLLWQTRWPSLRTGLLVLLLVQTAIPLAIHVQNGKISRALASWARTAPDETSILQWFIAQEQFIGRLALLENLGRLVGFALLGYGFWTASGYIWLGIGLGLLYPILNYFGMTRKDTRRRRQELRKRRDEFEHFHTA